LSKRQRLIAIRSGSQAINATSATRWKAASKLKELPSLAKLRSGQFGDEVEVFLRQVEKLAAAKLFILPEWRVAKKLGTVWKSLCRRKSALKARIFGPC